MNHSNHASGRVLYQKEEVPLQGCCFGLNQASHSSNTPGKEVNKRNSERKGSVGKKIEVTLRREEGLVSNQKRQLAMQARNGKLGKVPVKQFESTGAYTSLTSKLTSQRNSLHASTAKLQQHPPIPLNSHPNPQLRARSLSATPSGTACNQVRAQLNNIQLLSEISRVEQEFISQESTSMNTLHFLANFQMAESKESQGSARREDYAICSLREAHNPLERMQERKKGYRGSLSRTKLHL